MGNSASKKGGGAASAGSAAATSGGAAGGARTIPSVFRDTYSDLPTLQADLRKAGLESSNLIFAIDATKSNEWTGKKSFGGRSLHATAPGELNPYQQVLSIIGETCSAFDEDNILPAYIFGSAGTNDHSLMSLVPGDRPCYGIGQVLQAYSQVIPHVRLAGPTSFAPAIRKAIEITVANGNAYHILIIIADGQITRSCELGAEELSPQEEDTIKAVQEASQYPLSIIVVGVGDGEDGADPWAMMRSLDDRIPGRKVDNLQFVPFNELLAAVQRSCGHLDPASLKKSMECTFALNALMEVPGQYKAFGSLKMMGATGCAPKTTYAPRVRVLDPPVMPTLTLPSAPAPAAAAMPSAPIASPPIAAAGGVGVGAAAGTAAPYAAAPSVMAVSDGKGGTIVILSGGPGAPVAPPPPAAGGGGAVGLRTSSSIHV